MSGFDLADAERGIFASAQEGRAPVVFDHDEVLDADELALEVELSPLGPAARLGGGAIPAREFALCRALGTLRSPGREEELACLAVKTEEGEVGSDGEPPSLQRTIAIAFADGGLLALGAARPAGATEHGSEQVEAVRVDPGGAEQRFAEALLSTEYDGDGHQRRATLELWREKDGFEPPLRGAGTIICGTALRADGLRIETAFFRWALDGTPGLGRYEVVTR